MHKRQAKAEDRIGYEDGGKPLRAYKVTTHTICGG
jgi:hypothetical protein